MLEDHADLLPLLSQLIPAEILHRAAVDNHIAGTLSFKLIDNPDQRGFSGTGITDDAVDFTIMNREIHSVDRMNIVVLGFKYLDDLLQFNHAFPPFPPETKTRPLKNTLWFFQGRD